MVVADAQVVVRPLANTLNADYRSYSLSETIQFSNREKKVWNSIDLRIIFFFLFSTITIQIRINNNIDEISTE